MPALNLSFTEDEMAALRIAAEARDISLKSFVREAVLDAASAHKSRVRDAAKLVAERSTELNRRLA